ncbi:AMP-binding protein [Novosphingobium sp.]|uniref:AMP-binding protein n=1 Tax=Novosphingobium sp. TaxID=1874826 RepID=UPI00333FBF4A
MLTRTAQVAGQRRSTVFGAVERTWAQTTDRAARAGAALSALGVKAGDRVAVLALTSDRYVELLAGIPWAGGVVVALNWRWSLAELADALQDCEPLVLWCDRAMVATAQALAQGRPGLTLLALDEGPDGLACYEDLIAAAQPGVPVPRGGDDAFQLAYTGGTTGRSKAAIMTHRNVLVEALACHAEGVLGADSTFLLNGPMFHAAGTWPSLSIMSSGGTLVLMPQLEVEAALTLIERHRVTEALLVPTVLQMLLDHPRFAEFDLSAFRTILYGAAPITEALLDRALTAFPATRFVQCYGMTELAPVCAMLPHEYLIGPWRAAGAHRAAGRALIGVEIAIVDADDRPLPRGAVGEVIVRSETMMRGYWRRPEETAAALRGGWMHTGDAGYMDANGLVYVVDRVKDMIISGGENVYSTEVENALCSHPDVSEAAVFGIPDAKWGEAVHAVVRLRAGASVTTDAIIAHVRNRIAGYKVPRSIDVRTEPFPVTPANKILKRELRRPFWEGRGRAIV